MNDFRDLTLDFFSADLGAFDLGHCRPDFIHTTYVDDFNHFPSSALTIVFAYTDKLHYYRMITNYCRTQLISFNSAVSYLRVGFYCLTNIGIILFTCKQDRTLPHQFRRRTTRKQNQSLIFNQIKQYFTMCRWWRAQYY